MSRSNHPDGSRRRFLGTLAGSACLFGWLHTAVVRSQTATAPAGGQGGSGHHVAESEPLAQSLGYKDDASKVDKAKFSTFKPGEKCGNCRFFQGASGQSAGPCQIFGGELVSSTGWCSSYNAKT